MKKIFYLALSVFLFSCNDEKKEAENKTPVTTTEPKPLPEFAYPVDRAHWSIGDPGNTKLVLDMYHAWDQKDGAAVAGFFADSANMDMPDARRLALNKSNVYEKFAKARSQYDNTSNKIISAVSLHNDEYNEDWVQVMTYNKWEYKDGVKDSMLYFDNWRLVNGKINYLNSLQQKPPKSLLKTLESK
jgi:hypothetical protein